MKGLIFIAIIALCSSTQGGNLYTKPTPRRLLKSLDGVWKFSLSENGTFNIEENLSSKQDDRDVHLMPVPSSYNDILTTVDGREHSGAVKYERTFIVPNVWINDNNRVWLRFGSVCYSAEVYLNGEFVMFHQVGHLPFSGEITQFLNKDENILTVFVDNTLNSSSIPQGNVATLPGGKKRQTYTYDFFNYAGIDRSVYIYTTPIIYIDDLYLDPTVRLSEGTVSLHYVLTVGGVDANVGNGSLEITILDREKNEVTSAYENFTDIYQPLDRFLIIPHAKLWWPYLMDDDPGYLYTVRMKLIKDNVTDVYEQTFGVRQLTWTKDEFTINGRPIYIRGLGRHEDSDIRGKGLDLPLMIRDYNLMKWLGINCFRTSHYPYAEEIMDMADKLGIMIIDEVPAVNTDNYNDNLLENHKQALSELYYRDRSRPSVIMWSVANEPNTIANESEEYYKEVITHIRLLEYWRPITLVNFHYIDEAQNVFQYLDIISHNRYEGWYQDTGDPAAITSQILDEILEWRKTYNKPVLLTEYGADSLVGLHTLPSYIWSDEYHLDVLSEYFKAFDELRENSWFIGEMVWNFADFKTSTDKKRVGGNKKGIFTRNRQPKPVAHLLRKRYWLMAKSLYNITVPDDLEHYVINSQKMK